MSASLPDSIDCIDWPPGRQQVPQRLAGWHDGSVWEGAASTRAERRTLGLGCTGVLKHWNVRDL